jgi:hypothetical protein
MREAKVPIFIHSIRIQPLVARVYPHKEEEEEEEEEARTEKLLRVTIIR